MAEKVTKAQIARIWATANAIGLDRELLYLLVPRHSISALTRKEASELIEHLNELEGGRIGPARWSDKGPPALTSPTAPTQQQRDFIYFLLGRLGWLQQPQRVRGFLKRFAKVDAVEEIPTRKRASAIIEALKAIYRRSQRAKAKEEHSVPQ